MSVIKAYDFVRTFGSSKIHQVGLMHTSGYCIIRHINKTDGSFMGPIIHSDVSELIFVRNPTAAEIDFCNENA